MAYKDYLIKSKNMKSKKYTVAYKYKSVSESKY